MEKYLQVFDSSLHELRQLVSWDCKVPCMNQVLVNCPFLPEARYTDGVNLEEAHMLCIEPLPCAPGVAELLKKLRHAYEELGQNVFHVRDEPDFGISEFEKSFRRRRLRARLWTGCRRYRRGKFVHHGH